ncbi:MAG: DUF3147 family protein [Vampirovibrionales bacterium]|nr:DUF3147 family protein [Vampirovibrionales bacterium]
MLYYIAKLGLSAALILAVSEIAKRSPLLGAIVASLPLLSVLAMIWLYQETKNPQAIATLSYSIFWMVIPSLVLFISLPEFLKKDVPFYPALLFSSILTVLAYFLMIFLLSKIGTRI